MVEIKKKIRAAVYTRKSHEEGLEQEFNSLDAQREAGEAFVVSQRHEGWTLVPDNYDDGGFSGGSIERPAIKRLMKDIENGNVDVVVVYKIDRLTRSLTDFSKLIEVFDRRNVSFVSVTQQFNTTTSMGRLMLNVLLSFAQFEREVTGERIRDKFAASKKKGMWMGGVPPLGYDIIDRKLIINEAEAKAVRHIYERFTLLGSVTEMVIELRKSGYRSKTYRSQSGRMKEGRFLDKGSLYKILNNRVYIGEIGHKGQYYPGLHRGIIDREIWDKAQAIKAIDPHIRKIQNHHIPSALLKSVMRCSGCDSPILLLQPTLEMAEAWSKDRFAPMLRDTDVLRGLVKDPRTRDSGNTLLHKRFPGGHITMAGANSPASLASRPIRLVLCDEVDRYPASAGTEGDPVSLAKKRTTTFWNRKLLLTSTPTIKGASRIEAAFEQSDQRHFHVPCPQCGEYQTLKWGQVKWDSGDYGHKPETAHYVCEHNGCIIANSDRPAMLKIGRWVAEAPLTDIAGFHINELYSPWVTFTQIVTDFLRAKALPETLKTWVNTSLGEPWEEDGETIEADVLLNRKESWGSDAPERQQSCG